MEQIFFHIDVNSAFLSWTAIKLLKEGYPVDPRTTPSIIGGDKEKRHGVVLAKSIPAKLYEIRTGEPLVSALRKCPDLLVLPPDHKYYSKCSEELMEHFHTFTCDIEQLSIDECFLDFTGISHNYDSPEAAATYIKDTVFEKFGFTVNVGISNNKLLAKMASDFKKPNLVHTLYPHEIEDKMWPLAVSELYMAGNSSVKILHNLGIFTIGDLAQTPRSILESHLKSHGGLLWEYANGIDGSPFFSAPPKNSGIGNSTTLSEDVTDRESAFHVLLGLSENVSTRLRASKQTASTISVEIKYSDFVKVSHQMQLSIPTNNTSTLYEKACYLFDQLWSNAPIRLLGIRTSKLASEDEPVQLSLFDMDISSMEKRKKMDGAIDSIRLKFGNNAILRASFLNNAEESNDPSENK
ncbi:MAG: DNA polymerase IV [Clostridiales bacterium]|nr:DNA polymerase IV [Clostridiales bacterium]